MGCIRDLLAEIDNGRNTTTGNREPRRWWDIAALLAKGIAATSRTAYHLTGVASFALFVWTKRNGG